MFPSVPFTFLVLLRKNRDLKIDVSVLEKLVCTKVDKVENKIKQNAIQSFTFLINFKVQLIRHFEPSINLVIDSLALLQVSFGSKPVLIPAGSE